jgi:hypothetical protein
MEVIGPIFKVIAKLFCLVKGINCARTTAVVLPSGCGKSYLSSNYTSRSEALLLDLEDLSRLSFTTEQVKQVDHLISTGNKQSLLMWLLPHMKDFFKSIRSKFQSRDIVVLVSQPEILDYLSSYINKKLIFVPSEAFFNQIIGQVEDEAKRREMTASRTSIISQAGRKARVFTSWSDLSAQLHASLDVTQRV